MRLPRDSVGVPAASLRPSSSSSSSSSSPSCKLVGNKENVQPPEGNGESSTAANLLWLLDFRLDNLLPNDGNSADKMAHVQGILILLPRLASIKCRNPFRFICRQ